MNCFCVHVFEFTEDVLRVFAQNVGQHVEPAPVGHAEDDFVDALLAGVLDGQIEQRNERFRTFQREAFRPDVFFTNEFLENDGVGQAGQNAQLLVPAQLDAVAGAFHPLLQPLRAPLRRECA